MKLKVIMALVALAGLAAALALASPTRAGDGTGTTSTHASGEHHGKKGEEHVHRKALDLTQSDLAVSSPYNTRAHPGLPPTPIASPQLSSIQAALQPAQTADLYFVLGSDCLHHVFTSSYQEFLRAKAKQPTC